MNRHQQSRGYGNVVHFLHRRRIPLIEALAAVRAEHDAQPSLLDSACDAGYCGV